MGRKQISLKILNETDHWPNITPGNHFQPNLQSIYREKTTHRRLDGQSFGAGAFRDEILKAHGVLFAQFVSVGLVHQILLLL